jgi:adenosine deaminase
MSNVSLSDEYAGLAAAFGWDAATFARTNATALDAAFCDDQTKQQVNARLSR